MLRGSSRTKRVRFDDVVMMERLFEQLSAEEATEGSACPFREWEILHELDRQQRRREYDKSPQRIELRRQHVAERTKVLEYLDRHPKVRAKMEARVRKGIAAIEVLGEKEV